jgi:hypothetical protein
MKRSFVARQSLMLSTYGTSFTVHAMVDTSDAITANREPQAAGLSITYKDKPCGR